MSYGWFLAVFLGLPLVFISAVAKRVWARWLVYTLITLSLLALLYTTPWDNLIVANGVWSYGPHRIVGILIGHVPLEECLFYVLQVALTGTLAGLFFRRAEN